MVNLATLVTEVQPGTYRALRFCIINEYTPKGFLGPLFTWPNMGIPVQLALLEFSNVSRYLIKRPNLI